MAILLTCTGCRQGASQEETAIPPEQTGTPDPDAADVMTLQAEVEATAAWVGTLIAGATPSPTMAVTLASSSVTGTPISLLVGACVQPEGYTLHLLEDFCISAPAGWRANNYDGGIASALGTTPGRAIALQPDWADSTGICQLVVYMVGEGLAEAYLGDRYQEYSDRPDLAELSALQVQPVGDLSAAGFTWELKTGEKGAVFAESLGMNRLIHISYSGTACRDEEIVAVIRTLRFY
jgi:hypothetical protein